MQTVFINNHPFTVLGTVDHIRLDGQPTTLYRWRTCCAHDQCSASWEFKTPALNRLGALVPPDDPSRHYPLWFKRHFCKRHARRQVTPTTYASRRLVSDDDVVQMHELAKSHQGSRGDLYAVLALCYGVTPGTAREILSGRKRKLPGAPAPQNGDRACTTTGGYASTPTVAVVQAPSSS